jgi:hypothetical protein
MLSSACTWVRLPPPPPIGQFSGTIKLILAVLICSEQARHDLIPEYVILKISSLQFSYLLYS